LKTISQKWLDLFALIPGGYDPVATAGECRFDEETADRAVGFFSSHLTHIEGAMANKPLELEPWEKAFVGCIFGWKRIDGTRRYREAMLFVPRKNGKSTLCGGLINLVGLCDEEPGAQLYSAAAEREQAALIYRQAKGMILNNPELEAVCKIYTTYKSIEYPGSGNVYKALSADANTKHGFNTHFVVVDELHAQPNRDLVDVLVTSTGARRQPLIIYITTADFDRESICNEKHDYACGVRDGLTPDVAFFPMIYETAADADWKSPETWRKANPNIGVSISEEYLARECLRAQTTPTYENTFKRLHLNMKTQNDKKWDLTLDIWDGCIGPVDLEFLKGRRCVAGLDLSTTFDIAASVLVFPLDAEGEKRKYLLLPRFWIPGTSAEKKEKIDRVPYQLWARQGLVTLVNDWTVDLRIVKKQILEDAKAYDLREVVFDPFNAKQIAKELQEESIEVVSFTQNHSSYHEPTIEIEKLAIERRLIHGANPILRWMVGNVAIEYDPAGHVKPSKRKSTNRIDGIAASIMGLGRAMLLPEDVSVYQTRGLLTI
jgi:phage terminase large subunit-like protein